LGLEIIPVRTVLYFSAAKRLRPTQTVYAVDVAPRISDREIIESLAQIKVDIKANPKLVEQRFRSIDQHFDQQNQSMNKRFDDIHQSIDKIWTPMMVVIAGIFGLIEFVIWDRKTALRPLEKRLDNLEKDFQHDLELRHENGSLLTQLVKNNIETFQMKKILN